MATSQLGSTIKLYFATHIGPPWGEGNNGENTKHGGTMWTLEYAIFFVEVRHQLAFLLKYGNCPVGVRESLEYLRKQHQEVM